MFKHSGSKFRRLYASAHGGIIVENNLVVETTNGTLDLFWSTGDLRLHPNVSLIANHADLVLNSDASEIIADYPGILMSTTDDIVIPMNLFLQRVAAGYPTTSPSAMPSASPSSEPSAAPSTAPSNLPTTVTTSFAGSVFCSYFHKQMNKVIDCLSATMLFKSQKIEIVF